MAEISAYQWAKGTKSLRAAGRELGQDLLINNQPPKHGQIMTNPNLACTFQVHRIPWAQFIYDIHHQGLNRVLQDCNKRVWNLFLPITGGFKKKQTPA